MNSLTEDHDRNTVVEIVKRLVQESGDPWGQAIDLVRQGLLDQGYFTEEKRMRLGRLALGKRLVPDCGRIATLEGQVAEVEGMLKSQQTRHPDVYAQLVTDVQATLKALRRVDD